MKKEIDTKDFIKKVEEKYGVSLFQSGIWQFRGTIEDKKVEIEFCDDGFTLAVPLGEERFLESIIPFFSELAEDGPICRYNLADSNGTLIDITVEWNAITPSLRMNNILKGTGFNRGLKAINLVEYYLSDDRKVELAQWNQFSPALFKGFHISDERLYEHFKSCPEADLVLIIKTFANFWGMVHSRKWAGSHPDPTDFPAAIDAAWKSVEERFLKPELAEDIADQSLAWSNWWMDYFDLDTHLAYMQKRIKEEDVSGFRPEGKWEDLLVKKSEVLAHQYTQ